MGGRKVPNGTVKVDLRNRATLERWKLLFLEPVSIARGFYVQNDLFHERGF